VSLIIGTQGNAGEIGIYAGIELGYFQEEGLEINPQYFRTGPEALPALAAGHIDIGNGGVGASFFNAPARGIPLKMVADLQFISPTYRGTVWAVRSELIDSGQVKEAKDFKGLTVGLGSLGTASDIDLDKILDAGGLTRADIEIKTLPYTDMVAAFANKSIDFAYVFEPIRTTILEQRTAKEWKTSGEIYPNHESSVVFYGPTMEQKREAGRRFMVGYLRGVRWAREMYEKRDSQVYELTARWATIKDPELLRKLVPPEANPDGSVYRGSLENDLAYYVGQNLVDQPPDLDQVIDNTYVEYAISRLGKYKPGCGPSPCP